MFLYDRGSRNLIESFNEDIEKWQKDKICSSYPRVTKKQLIDNGIIILGAGVSGEHCVSMLLSCGISTSWIVDRDTSLHGTCYNGIEIRPYSSLKEAGDSFVMLASTHVLEMISECKKYDISKWILPASTRDFCHLGDVGICNSSDDIEDNRDNMLMGFSLMPDEKSRQVYRAYIKYHHVFDNEFSRLCDPIHYFPEDLKHLIDYRCFVDVGAYTGDTLNDWVMMYKPDSELCAYYAFEPFYPAFCKLNENMAALPNELRKKVFTFNMALGRENGFVNILGGQAGTHVSKTNDINKIQSSRIDDIFQTEAPPTYIKADVEGAELDVLSGAESTIRHHRPALAIAVYHKYSDIWEIPIWINNLNCDYDIHLRHHPKVFTDTICYAIPK